MKYKLLVLFLSLINSLFRSQATDRTCDLTQIYLKDKLFCDKCIDNCLICDSNQECQKCKDGFYLDMNFQCQKTCQIRQFQSQENSICQICPIPNCLQCSNMYTCDQCINSFSLSDDKTQCIGCKKEDQMIINGQNRCSLQCYAFLNTVQYENCSKYNEFQDLNIQFSVFQTQPLETLLQINKYTTAITNEDIVIGITKTQVHLFHTYPNLQLYKIFSLQNPIIDQVIVNDQLIILFKKGQFTYLIGVIDFYEQSIKFPLTYLITSFQIPFLTQKYEIQ
ncbi:hypothetical protein TTHERM_000845778 (macronuclear) [Tetrahymena thermophila SB210]|uniref:Transmembrane protein n=1 Tax=Tetrahymena thermophila (strain SB210) TaxID=312017 RepID=W7XJY5_TETTS|nr:hypothetical protein TTHERM_000845778 [Tetrahymena thermophila SB210]EWS76056.1 hypothetical protein TTHERM_000845778 [Tetrahymena thermophila SB210]|eukprot:XP_012651407.1 hypothetical protein TTHERM_000845778 [Tetrahymena thermophila SB210]